MDCLVGIDIGTSSLKTIIMDRSGRIISSAAKEYNFDVPMTGYAEQDPKVWWNALVSTVREVLQKSNVKPDEIRGIGFSGQMHGMVPLDKDMNVIRKCILHCDVRSAKECRDIEAEFPGGGLNKIVYNPIFPGMQLVSLVWMRENEPFNYERTFKVVCPKDYIRYLLTGELGVEHTDASGTIAYDINARDWAYDAIHRLKIEKSFFPAPIHLPFDVAGSVSAEAAAMTGLLEGTPVVYGGGDQAMQSIGNGLYLDGSMIATIGTSGQVMRIADNPAYNPKLNTHTFAHVLPGVSFSLGAVLNAGITLNWFRKNFAFELSYEQMSMQADSIRPCCEGLAFFPAMMGERTPYLDANTRGVFIGASFIHTKAHFIRAIMEGVTFEMKSAIDILNSFYGEPEYIVAAGGASKSRVWLQMQADIYNKTVCVKNAKEQACVGAAIMAGIGSNVYADIKEACNEAVPGEVNYIEPVAGNAEKYAEYYDRVFSRIYDGNKTIFQNLAR